MRKFILGIVMFVCGILGCIGMFLTEAIIWAGQSINLWRFFGRNGIVIPLIIFSLVTVIGFIIACINVSDRNETFKEFVGRQTDKLNQ